MKKTFTLFMLMLFVVAATAQPLEPRPMTYKQSDGTKVTAYLHSNCHSNVKFYTTLDGIALVKNSNGDLCYAIQEGTHLKASERLAHNADMRQADELLFLSTNHINLQGASKIVRNRGKLGPKAQNNLNEYGLGTYGQSGGGSVNSIGEWTMPIIMVEFSDLTFQESTTEEVLQNRYNMTGYTSSDGSVGSSRDYFTDQSRGMFQPNFPVVAKVKLNKSYRYYGKDEGDNKDVNLNYFVSDALAAAVKQGVNLSDYVQDGAIPCVIFIYAGCGQATASYEEDSDDFLWPCQFEYSKYVGPYNGCTINACFIGNEIEYNNNYSRNGSGDIVATRVGNPRLAGIGTFCHEFGHALGLPDFYCTNYSHSKDPMGYWDIMDRGCYLNNGYAPIGHTAYERNFLGWLPLRELQYEESVVLNSPFAENGESAVLIKNNLNPKEYYIFENRQAGKWYPTNMSGGMLGIHVDYNAASWARNELNNDANHLRMQVVHPVGGETNYKDYLYPGTYSITEIGGTDLQAFTGGTLNKPIYKIAVKKGEVTFNFLSEEISSLKPGESLDTLGGNFLMNEKRQLVLMPRQDNTYVGDFVVPASVNISKKDFDVVGIGEDCFGNSDQLTSVQIGKNVKSISETAFRNTPALKSIRVDEANEKYEVVNGALMEKKIDPSTLDNEVLFDFDQNVLNLPFSDSQNANLGNITEPLVYKNVTIATTNGTSTPTRLYKATTIQLRMYAGSSMTISVDNGMKIAQIEFTSTSDFNLSTDKGTLTDKVWTGSEESVTFQSSGKSFLKTIHITLDGLKSPEWPLICYPQGNTGEYSITEGVEALRPYAFEGTKLSVLNIPATVVNIGKDALSSSTLRYISVASSTPVVCAENPFTLVDLTNCTLNVPEGAEAAYRDAAFWKNFSNISVGINDVMMDSTDKAVYDLQGRKLNGVPSQRGLYIIGGKKVLK